MRYTSSHPRAFRNRIARYLGVLVAAALIATLGLPSASQAQTIDAADDGPAGVVFATIWPPPVASRSIGRLGWRSQWTANDNWKLDRDVHPARRLGSRGGPAHHKRAWHSRCSNLLMSSRLGLPPALTYDRNEVGTWWFQVSACLRLRLPRRWPRMTPTAKELPKRRP